MKQIVIPRNTLVVLSGPAGCGKSTFAAKHFLPTEIVSSDDCRARLSDDAANQGVSPQAFDLMRFIIEKRLMLGRLTVADATHLDRAARRTLTKIGRRFGFNLAIFVFDIPLKTCLARNSGRDRIVPEEALKRQYLMLDRTLEGIIEEDFDYVFVLDELMQARTRIKIGRRFNRPPERPLL